MSSPTDSYASAPSHARTVFVCGYVPKRWHNSSLNSIMVDMSPFYYVSCNGSGWSAQTKCLVSQAECLLFFVNEYTLADRGCLLALQRAWQLMTPIVMLRPPRTRLVITARGRLHSSIVYSPLSSLHFPFPQCRHDGNGCTESLEDDVDYALLQDILYQGYAIAVVYDRLDHDKSMRELKKRIAIALTPFGMEEVENKGVSAQLSTGDAQRRPATPGRLGTRESRSKSQRSRGTGDEGSVALPHHTPAQPPSSMRLSHSMGSLTEAARGRINSASLGQRRANPSGRRINIQPIKVEVDGGELASSEKSPSANTSSSSPFDRRASILSFDDLSNYTTTQYLIFPIHDISKKPQLVRFPTDLLDESTKRMDSPWGSDPDLQEEVEIAPRINGDIGMLDEADSPIASPAPYTEPI